MSFFWQLMPWYNTMDEWQNISDIQGVLWLFSSEQQKQFEHRILSIISEPDVMLYKVRNLLYATVKSSLIQDKDIEMQSKNWIDFMNGSYKRLDYLYEVIANNPILWKAFLETLASNISEKLAKFSVKENSLAKKINEISDENFHDTIAKVSQDGWHPATIYLLGECIREWKCLENVRYHIHNNAWSTLSSGNLEDMDYQNLLSQLDFQSSINSKNRVGKSFSLSGGISNSLSQLGYISAFLADWGQIQSISGTSMGAIVGVLVSKAVWKKTWREAASEIDTIISALSWKLETQIKALPRARILPFIHIPKFPKILTRERTVISKKDIAAIENVFLSIAHEYGITDTTQFSELEIPVIVNSSYQSGWKWEKEIALSWENKIIESLFAWANMPGFSTKNNGLFGKRSVQGQDMVDFAANEQGNPISLLTNSGIPSKDIIALDVWYSSNSYNTFAAKFSRWFYRRALFRDSLQKSAIIMQWWTVIDIDSKPSMNSSWSNFSPTILADLVKIGQESFEKTKV